MSITLEYHGLAQSQALDAIKSLNQPVTVLSSHKKMARYIVTNVIDNDNIPISIYIHPNGTAYINNKEIKSTHIRAYTEEIMLQPLIGRLAMVELIF